ncbi:MAG: restriction endonuclease subunit S [Spirochaetia bacterium]|nr:restriction endonuclease subunit S [Spirochaetia bacterium]
MRNSGVEWIGEIPEDWEVKPVKRYFSHVKRIVGDDVDKYERLSLTMQGVLKRSKDDAEGLQPEKFNGYQILKQNELVFKLIDLENVNTSRVGISPFNGLVSPAYIILSNNKKDNTFYYYWFLNMYYQEIFNKLGDGGVRSALNASDVLSLPMVYLNNETQQRIASYLDKKCNKIEETIQNQQQVIEKLKAYKQSLITEAVTGKVKIENGKACGEYESYKDSGVEWIGRIPSGWEIKKLKYIADSFSKGSGITKEEIVINGDKPCVRYGELYTKYDYHFTECQTRTNLGIIETPKYFSHGDVLFTCTGEIVEEIGKSIAYLGNEKCLAGGDIIVLKHSQDPMFMGFALDSKYVQGQKSFGKTKLKVVHISSGEIARLLIVLPPKEEQKEIANYLDKKCTAIDTAIEQKQNLIEKLTEYKKSLIYECVTGKKEI